MSAGHSVCRIVSLFDFTFIVLGLTGLTGEVSGQSNPLEKFQGHVLFQYIPDGGNLCNNYTSDICLAL